MIKNCAFYYEHLLLMFKIDLFYIYYLTATKIIIYLFIKLYYILYVNYY
jgi:hypothetical protein